MAGDITIKKYLANARLVKEQLPTVIADAMMKNDEAIVAMNQQQLYDGKTVTGADIHPLYSQDSFFKTAAQAKGYIKWKQKITPNSNRNPDAPNLFINGYFHRSLRLVRVGLNIFIRSSAGALGNEISGKYQDVLGLNSENQQKANSIIFPDVMNFINKYL